MLRRMMSLFGKKPKAEFIVMAQWIPKYNLEPAQSEDPSFSNLSFLARDGSYNTTVYYCGNTSGAFHDQIFCALCH